MSPSFPLFGRAGQYIIAIATARAVGIRLASSNDESVPGLSRAAMPTIERDEKMIQTQHTFQKRGPSPTRRDLMRGCAAALAVSAIPTLASGDDSPVRRFMGSYDYA